MAFQIRVPMPKAVETAEKCPQFNRYCLHSPDLLTYDLRILDDLDQKRRDSIQEELEWYLKEEAARLEKEAKT